MILNTNNDNNIKYEHNRTIKFQSIKLASYNLLNAAFCALYLILDSISVVIVITYAMISHKRKYKSIGIPALINDRTLNLNDRGIPRVIFPIHMAFAIIRIT